MNETCLTFHVLFKSEFDVVVEVVVQSFGLVRLIEKKKVVLK